MVLTALIKVKQENELDKNEREGGLGKDAATLDTVIRNSLPMKVPSEVTPTW